MRNRVAELRERMRLDRAGLAEALGVSGDTVAATEKGKYDPSLPLAKEMARLFRVSVEDVFPVAPEEVVATTATFVMTDIEGSTELVHRLGPRYVDLLRRHRELLVDVFTTRGGRVVDDTGDACFAAFERAPDAVAAALAAQRAVATETWPDGAEPKVRIGVHTGEAFAVGNRFVGLGVHEAARVCEAARGGQVIVSETTAAVGDATELVDGGSHELKGVGRRRLWVVDG